MCLVHILYYSASVCGMVFDYLYLGPVVRLKLYAVMFDSEGPAKSRTHPLGVSVICLDRCVVVAPLGAYP